MPDALLFLSAVSSGRASRRLLEHGLDLGPRLRNNNAAVENASTGDARKVAEVDHGSVRTNLTSMAAALGAVTRLRGGRTHLRVLGALKQQELLTLRAEA